MGREDLCQIWYFIQNLQYSCAYTPHYNQERMIKLENIPMSFIFNKYKICPHLKECANTYNLQ